MKYFLLGFGSMGLLFNLLLYAFASLHTIQFIHIGLSIVALIIGILMKETR